MKPYRDRVAFCFRTKKMLAKNTKHLTEKEKNRKINIEVVTCFRKNEEKRLLEIMNEQGALSRGESSEATCGFGGYDPDGSRCP